MVIEDAGAPYPMDAVLPAIFIMVKGVTRRGYKASRLDVVTGCIFTDVVAWTWFIVACAATLYVHGFRDIKYAADAAQAFGGAFLAGGFTPTYCSLWAYSTLRCSRPGLLPLSTAYTVCEGLGLGIRDGREFSEAPFFYWLYTFLIAAGGALVLMIPSERLVRSVLWSQVLNGVVLPFVSVFMLLLINKKN